MTCRESKGPATAPVNGPQEFERFGGRLNSIDNSNRPRRQRLCERLHELRPAPLFHFIADIERGCDIDETLEEYAALPADLIRACRGDKFLPPAFAIGRRP